MIRPIIGQPSQPATRGKTDVTKRRKEETAADAVFTKPRKQADENYIPAPESLSTLIRNAIAAMKKGVTWERGSIINLNI